MGAARMSSQIWARSLVMWTILQRAVGLPNRRTTGTAQSTDRVRVRGVWPSPATTVGWPIGIPFESLDQGINCPPLTSISWPMM